MKKLARVLLFAPLFGAMSNASYALEVTQGKIEAINVRTSPAGIEVQFSPGAGCEWITIPKSSDVFPEIYSGLLAAMTTGKTVRINTGDNTTCYPQLNMGVKILK